MRRRLVLGLIDVWRRRRGVGADGRSRRGQRAARRPAVAARRPARGGADAALQRRRRLGRARGRLCADRLGDRLARRRSRCDCAAQDLRTLVGCGAAGAMAAAFGAPLTGAFYAFELIIGAYSLGNAAPVLAAAVAGRLTVHVLGGAPYSIEAPPVPPFGVAAACRAGRARASSRRLLGVAAMRAAARGRARRFAPAPLPAWARPVRRRRRRRAARGLTPQVLGAGHGALALDIPRSLSAAAAGGADRPQADRVPRLAGQRVSRRPVLRLAVHRRAARQALRDRHGGALPGLRLDPTACLFAGMATLGAAIVGGAADHGVSGAGELRRRARGGPVLAACIASQLTVQGDFRLFVLDLAAASARRGHFRRAGRRLGAHDPGGGLMDAEAAHHAGRRDARRFPARPSARQRALCGARRSPRAATPASSRRRRRMRRARTATPSPRWRGSPTTTLSAGSEHPRGARRVRDGAVGNARRDRCGRRRVGALGEAYAARRYAAAVDRAAKGVLGGVTFKPRNRLCDQRSTGLARALLKPVAKGLAQRPRLGFPGGNGARTFATEARFPFGRTGARGRYLQGLAGRAAAK